MAKYKTSSTGNSYRLAGILVGLFMMIIVSGVEAQGPGTGGLETTPNGPDTNTSGVPIDGGLGFLLVAGAGYGVKRIRKMSGESKKKVKSQK